jgi:hypothetical protein
MNPIEPERRRCAVEVCPGSGGRMICVMGKVMAAILAFAVPLHAIRAAGRRDQGAP